MAICCGAWHNTLIIIIKFVVIKPSARPIHTPSQLCKPTWQLSNAAQNSYWKTSSSSKIPEVMNTNLTQDRLVQYGVIL